MKRFAILLFCVFLANVGWCQQDICQGYQQTPDAPHQGPSRFNGIDIAFSLVDSYVLIVDPEGHRFGIDSSGKPVRREIVRAYYQDDNTAEMDTNLLAARKPREMSIDYAQSGKYLLVITARTNTGQSLKLRTSTCGKIWRREITIPASKKGSISRFTLVYDSHAKEEPQILEGDHTKAEVKENR